MDAGWEELPPALDDDERAPGRRKSPQRTWQRWWVSDEVYAEMDRLFGDARRRRDTSGS